MRSYFLVGSNYCQRCLCCWLYLRRMDGSGDYSNGRCVQRWRSDRHYQRRWWQLRDTGLLHNRDNFCESGIWLRLTSFWCSWDSGRLLIGTAGDSARVVRKHRTCGYRTDGSGSGNGNGNTKSMAEGVKSGINQQPKGTAMGASRDKRAHGRSILSTRSATDTAFLSGMDERLAEDTGNKKSFPGNVVATGGKASSPTSRSTDPAATANDIQEFRESMTSSSGNNGGGNDNSNSNDNVIPISRTGEEQASELVALAGAGNAFEGSTLGIGGLDDVFNQIKRRVWVPLAAPPSLLAELGISPVRGLLLYGLPGCGKTLLARSIGKILSPARPITVVSGPEIMDRFVGSSESNLREIFDSPPPIVDSYRVQYPDMGAALEKNALHVVIMDEFDSIARSRGGGDGKGSQGDAGVARDSVVNQMLAKMDGVDPLPVPTLVRRTMLFIFSYFLIVTLKISYQ